MQNRISNIEPRKAFRFDQDEVAEPQQMKEARLTAEIASRLIEWAQLASRKKVTGWLNTLTAIHRADSGGPDALWLYIAYQTGDTAAIAASFEEKGEAKALPRQAVHQAFTRALKTIASIKPELAQAMREVYERHSPEARAAGDGFEK